MVMKTGDYRDFVKSSFFLSGMPAFRGYFGGFQLSDFYLNIAICFTDFPLWLPLL